MSESTEVISMFTPGESLSARSPVTSHARSRQNLPPRHVSSGPPRLQGASDWTGADCCETFCPTDEAAGLVIGGPSAPVDGHSGSGCQDGGALVASVLWLELRDCRMKLKLELKESSGEDRTAGLNPSSF